jgi:hypothetical protein
VARQPSLHGSARAYRGALLHLLAATDGHAIAGRAARRALDRDAARIGPALDDAGWDRVVTGLERDGLLHRSRGRLLLGTATIGA